MDSLTIIVSALAFCLSFIFALGGVGSAVVLVPVLHWLGYPLNEAKPTGLFVNTVSLMGASVSNIRNRRLDFRLGIPIILASVVMAPAGAYLSTMISQRTVLIAFVAFLLFSGNMMLFFKPAEGRQEFRDDRPVLPMLGIGSAAGFISGLLGVGGGGLISPAMILMGFNPKKVAAITAFVVPFSSLTGFAAYWSMGHFNAALVLPVGLAAYAGGYMGTHFMHLRMDPRTVKRFLAFSILLLAIRMLGKVF